MSLPRAVAELASRVSSTVQKSKAFKTSTGSPVYSFCLCLHLFLFFCCCCCCCCCLYHYEAVYSNCATAHERMHYYSGHNFTRTGMSEIISNLSLFLLRCKKEGTQEYYSYFAFVEVLPRPPRRKSSDDE